MARVFCLTFETRFFGSFGFVEIDGAPVPQRSTRSCCARTTRASPSSSAWNGSSRTPWATRGCCWCWRTDDDDRVAAIDCGTNSIRLLIADPPADGGELRRPGPADGDRPARAGRRPHRPARARGDRAHPGGAGRLRGADRRRSARDGYGWWPRRRPGTRPTPTTSATWCAATLGVGPRGHHRRRRRRGCRSPVRCAACPPGRVPGGRHRRRLDRVRPRHRPLWTPADQRGHRLRADDRAAPARRPAHRGADRGGDARTSTAAVDKALVGRRRRRPARPWSASPVPSRRSPAIALDLPAYDPDRIHHAQVSAVDVRRVADELLAMTARSSGWRYR